MSAKRYFVDTNVLLYALDPSNLAKQQACSRWLDRLWREGSGALSWQVLHELCVNGEKKLKFPAPLLQETIRVFGAWRPVEPSLGQLERAWHWQKVAQVSLWDGLILASAERASCAYLLSEDFQAGRTYGGVTVISPFVPHA